jgi:hypothetical protein
MEQDARLLAPRSCELPAIDGDLGAGSGRSSRARLASISRGRLSAPGICASTYDASGSTSTMVNEESCSRRRSSSREISGLSDELAAVTSEAMDLSETPFRIVSRHCALFWVNAKDRRLAAQCGARELAAAVRHNLVDVHVELRAAARHPHMQRKHVVVLPGQDLVAGLYDQPVSRVIQPPTSRDLRWLPPSSALRRQ